MIELKPWPADWVPIVAATPDEVRIENMRGEPVGVSCNDCHCALVADSYTINFAKQPHVSHGRSIGFFCIECHLTYDRSMVDRLYDHRRSATP